jgi:hypothetical protein
MRDWERGQGNAGSHCSEAPSDATGVVQDDANALDKDHLFHSLI